MKCVFYSQHLFGIGHYVRTLSLAEAVVSQGGTAVHVSAGEVPRKLLAPSGMVQRFLPATRFDLQARRVVTASGDAPSAGFLRLRARQLLHILADERPDFFVVEYYPFGRRAFANEYRMILESVKPLRRSGQLRTIVSVRDIPFAGLSSAEHKWLSYELQNHFDLVLVHAERNDCAFDWDKLTLPPRIPVRFTGFVAEPDCFRQQPEPAARWFAGLAESNYQAILIAVGGGAASDELSNTLETAVRAAIGDTKVAVLSVRGPLSSRCETALHGNIRVEHCTPGLRDLAYIADLVITSAGYNSVVASLQSPAALLLVPSRSLGETEQEERAKWAARKGWAELVDLQLPSRKILPQQISRALSAGTGRRQFLARGAANSAQVLAAMLHRRQK